MSKCLQKVKCLYALLLYFIVRKVKLFFFPISLHLIKIPYLFVYALRNIFPLYLSISRAMNDLDLSLYIYKQADDSL